MIHNGRLGSSKLNSLHCAPRVSTRCFLLLLSPGSRKRRHTVIGTPIAQRHQVTVELAQITPLLATPG